MKISFLGKNHTVYKMQFKNVTSYTVADQNGTVKKIIKHTVEKNNNSRKREILSPESDLLELTIYEKIQGKDVTTNLDSKGQPRRISITENNGNERNSVITTYFDGGEKVSKLLSIEENSILTNVSEIMYDESGEISKTFFGTYLKNH